MKTSGICLFLFFIIKLSYARFEYKTNSLKNKTFKNIDDKNLHVVNNNESFYSQNIRLFFNTLNENSINPKGRNTEKNINLFMKNVNNFILQGSRQTHALAISKDDISRQASNNDSKQCYQDFMVFMESISKEKPDAWALSMIDSFGKPSPNILNGEVKWFGNYQECKNIYFNNTDTSFSGKYCTVGIVIPLLAQAAIQEGVCMPNSCDDESTVGVLRFALARYDIKVFNAACQNGVGKFTDDTRAIAVVSVLCFIGLMILLGTIYDIYARVVSANSDGCVPKGQADFGTSTTIANTDQDIINLFKEADETTPLFPFQHADGSPNSKKLNIQPHMDKGARSSICSELLLSLSVLKNGEKILSTHQGKDSITCIHGIRFISMTWVILGHTFVFGLNLFANVYTYAKDISFRWTFWAIANAFYSVDTFFVMSGFLVTYLSLKELQTRKLNAKFFFNYYFHRFWRLTPPYMLILMTYVPLSKYFGEGPLWLYNGFEKNYCKDSWWKNILYINNFFKMEDTCMGWAWYLANDMQFYLISPLIFIPLHFFPTAGLLVPCLLLAGNIIVSGVVADHFKFGVSPLDPNNGDYMDFYYVKPYIRGGAYLVGSLAGYIYMRFKGRVRLNKIVVFFGWCIALAAALATVYGPYDAKQKASFGNQLSSELSAFYNSFSKIAWAASVSWVILVCAFGSGEPTNTFLSWSGFVPLSRLTYCAYLVHPILMTYYYASVKSLFFINDVNLVVLFLFFIVVSYAVAFLATLVYESPWMALEKVIFRPKKSQKKPSEL